jgi:hypothetical protein
MILLYAVLLVVFVPVNTYWGQNIAGILSTLVASLIIGYRFAAQIHEKSRRGAISRIAVLFAVVLMFVVLALVAVNPHMQTAMDESLESTYLTSGWTTTDWAGYSWVSMVMLVAVNTVIVLVFSFIGLYAGSMLKRLSKSGK